ncbi:MAG: hypothetical protein HY246_13095 [Proteobacteria bacterium]|nr:hypothetical protein [Pseudomonadota bacterium]
MGVLSNIADRIVDSCKRYWTIERERRQLAEEFASLGRDDTVRILRDIGLAEGSLGTVVRSGPRSRELLKGMYARLSVSDEAPRRDPAVARAIERQCLVCAAQRRCRHWLASGGNPDEYREFCPNAEMLDLLRSPSRTPADGAVAELR